MTLYIRTTDLRYPADPRRDHPGVSFPAGWPGGSIDGSSYAVVRATESPSPWYAEGVPELVGGEWVQSWVGRNLEEVREDLHRERSERRVQAQTGGYDHEGNTYASDLNESIPLLINTALSAQIAILQGEAAVLAFEAGLGDGWRCIRRSWRMARRAIGTRKP